MLEIELAFFDENISEWLPLYQGKFVLVKDRNLIGIYDSNEQALSVGASLFGLESFLVRRVTKEKEEINFPALTLGLLYANPTHSTYSTRTNS